MAVTIDEQEYLRLKSMEREYRVTVALVAVLVEQITQGKDTHRLTVSDRALTNPPEYRAWRDPANNCVVFETRRSHEV